MTVNESIFGYCSIWGEFDRYPSIPKICSDDVLGMERIVSRAPTASWTGKSSGRAPSMLRIPLSLTLSTGGMALMLLLLASGAFFFRRIRSSSKSSNQRRSGWWFRPSERNGILSHEGGYSDNISTLKRKLNFLARIGDDYGYAESDLGFIDDWRPTELPNLCLPLECSESSAQCYENVITKKSSSMEREVYLDYAGSALPMKSQLERIYQESSRLILGNPHSIGPAASRTAERIQRAESRVLSHLEASPGKYASLRLPETFYQSSSKSPSALHKQNMDQHPGYDVLFVSGATEAFKMVAERFPWGSSSYETGRNRRCQRQHQRSIFLYATNSHNSVVGMRQLAIQKGAKFHCLDLADLEQMTTVNDWKKLENEILKSTSLENDSGEDTDPACLDCKGKTRMISRHLLVFPSECNFGGDRPDARSIIEVARASGWYTMLDIAKHASTDRVSLNHLNPDFAALSFYKLFGDPTGVGALLVRRSVIPILFDDSRRHYQGGGSVDIMLPTLDYTVPKNRSTGLASFKNGTSHFRGISNLIHGFDTLDSLGGMAAIHRHAFCLAKELARLLRRMKHKNGMPVVHLYGAWGDDSKFLGCDANDDENPYCGPTVALNVFRSDGTAVGYNEVSKLASLNQPPIQFRTGCFCNPGACQRALNLNDKEAIDIYEKSGHVCGDHIDLANEMPTGAIRVSFGKDSIWEDMDAFVQFIEDTFKDNSTASTTMHLKNQESIAATKVRVTELYLFPIKSCAAQRTPKWPLFLPSGKLKYDREFAIVDTSGVALRMQKCPKLGLISPVIDLETDTMRISAPGKIDLVIRLSDDLYHGGENVVRVCGNNCGGRVWGDAFVSEWFSSFLDIQCWLARHSPSNSDDNKGRPIGDLYSRHGFSNEQPILLVSENAVEILNEVLRGQQQPPCHARRFRPNIVIRDTLDAEFRKSNQNSHIEDEWKTVSLPNGWLKFSVEGGCPRCTMVDYDPTTGQKGKTLRALASYRRKNGHIIFGIFLRAMAQPQQTRGSNNEIREHNDIADYKQDMLKNHIVWIQEGDTLECK